MRPTATHKLCKKAFKRSQGNTASLTAQHPKSHLFNKPIRKKRFKNRIIQTVGHIFS